MLWFILILAAIGLAVLLNYVGNSIKRLYKSEVSVELAKQNLVDEILTERDIQHLPQQLQKYLVYTGAVGKPKVRNFKATFEGEFKMNRKANWTKASIEQHNFFESMTRIFYMKLNMFGIPVVGRDKLAKGKGYMVIKILGLITVADAKGPEMDEGALVTMFNDMCFIAPATLIDSRITWESIDEYRVKGTLNQNGMKVSAELIFNKEGGLVNFITDNRYFSPTGKSYEKVRWSTPMLGYIEKDGRILPSEGEAIWHFPDRDFTYAKLRFEKVVFNIEE